MIILWLSFDGSRKKSSVTLILVIETVKDLLLIMSLQVLLHVVKEACFCVFVFWLITFLSVKLFIILYTSMQLRSLALPFTVLEWTLPTVPWPSQTGPSRQSSLSSKDHKADTTDGVSTPTIASSSDSSELLYLLCLYMYIYIYRPAGGVRLQFLIFLGIVSCLNIK